ncbi:EAL domain-containing protein [Shewanella holmiensis]|uniref:EAL domain-containing protein n=1 Tax=Shewanella holmiensis TaxID=2952222 RepID=A0A9X3AUL3_9GAMM|nr:EAL domain-containing protein [Shewanella holmiensis]MCT7940458.1 EAL domain-containing protein [Shewanella holmiensis]
MTEFTEPLLNKSFDWVWDIEKKRFFCDPFINIILGTHKSEGIQFKQLVELLDTNQANFLKINIEKAINTKQAVHCHLVFNIAKMKVLAEIIIEQGDLKKVNGEICFKLILPNQEEEIKIIKELFFKARSLLIVCGAQNRILIVNSLLKPCLGFEEYEVLGQNLFSFLPTSSSDLQEHLFDCENNGSWTGEMLINNKQQQQLPFKAQIFYYPNQDSHKSLFIYQLKKLDFTLSEMTQFTHAKMYWDWYNKIDFFAKIDQVKKQITDQESLVVFVINTLSSSKVNSVFSRWLIGQSIPKLKMFKSIRKLGILNDDQICGLFVSSKIVKDIQKDLTNIFSLLLKNDQQSEHTQVQCHIGVSIYHVDAEDNTKLLSHAVQALASINTDAIEFKTHKIKYFDKRVNQINSRKAKLEVALLECLELDNINVVYQPIINVRTFKIEKVEALARFTLHYSFEYSTQEVIEIAEEIDLIHDIDQKISSIAIAELPVLSAVLKNENLGLSINRSMVYSPKNRSTLDETLELINQCNIEASRITIELTESAIFTDNPQILKAIHRINENNIVLAIDDFGSGYTSFGSLTKLPAGLIKIDKEITTGIVKDKQRQLMIKMFAQFIHAMQGKIIVEGVETKEEFAILLELQVDYIQGYFFSKPLSLADHQHTVANIAKTVEKFQLNALISTKTHISSIMDLLMPTLLHVKPDDRIEDFVTMLEEVDRIAVLKGKKCIGFITQNEINAAISPDVNTDAETVHDRLTLSKRAHQIMLPVEHTCHSDFSIDSLIAHFCFFPRSTMVVTGKTGIYLGSISIEQAKVVMCNMLKQH